MSGLTPQDAESLLPQAQAAVVASQELLTMLEKARDGFPVEPLKVLLAVSNAAQKSLAAALAITFDAK